MLEDYPIDESYLDAQQIERTSSAKESYDPDAEDDLSREPEDGAVGGDGGFCDENEQEHTVAGEASAVAETTFHADDADDVSRFEWLHRLHSGLDTHRRERTDDDGNFVPLNPRHYQKRNSKYKRRLAESLCSAADLTAEEMEMVVSVVERTDFSRLTYLCSEVEGREVDVTPDGGEYVRRKSKAEIPDDPLDRSADDYDEFIDVTNDDGVEFEYDEDAHELEFEDGEDDTDGERYVDKLADGDVTIGRQRDFTDPLPPTSDDETTVGAVEVATVGVIGLVGGPERVQVPAEAVGIDDVHYVAREVADKIE